MWLFIWDKDFIDLSKEKAKKKYNELLIEYPSWAEVVKKMKKRIFTEDIKSWEHITISDWEFNGEQVELLSKTKDNQQGKSLIVPHDYKKWEELLMSCWWEFFN